MAQFTPTDPAAKKIHVVESGGVEVLQDVLTKAQLSWLSECGFSGALGAVALVPTSKGSLDSVVLGWGDPAARARGRFHFASVRKSLPAAVYEIGVVPKGFDSQEAALAWGFAGYRFDRYKASRLRDLALVLPKSADANELHAIIEGEFLTRDLINTPAEDMGPDAMQQAVELLADKFGAGCSVISGDDLITEGFPMIHAVGRAAAQAPRLLDLNWGSSGPKVTLVGKGVTFDTGGLNIKPGASMGLMKKDMGGAATVLGLAHMIMATDTPIQLRVLIPAVENSISAGAFRPGDVLQSRKGPTVEINNTDAEGRLVLADALALADEADPELIISMATLTGAARVAVGPDLAPFYCDDTDLCGALESAATEVSDPVWRMPFWTPYEKMIEPDIADLDNAPKGGFAGSITAALFLRRFVDNPSYIHFDIFGWSPSNLPGRPKGGVGMGARALFEVIKAKAAQCTPG